MNSKQISRMIKPIRVVVVDDSPLALEIIRRMLATASDIELVATAGNGADALQRVHELKPDVLCTDFHMPVMDGLALTRELMRSVPLPILVMSTSLQPGQKNNIFAMLDAGALDVLAKPVGSLDADFGVLAHDLLQKIRVLSGVKVFRRRAPAIATRSVPVAGPLPRTALSPRIIGIGASTGGPQALETILKALPGDFPVPFLCVQHIAQGFVEGLVKWLAGSCRIDVRIAEPGDVPKPGTAYFASDNRHLEVDAEGRFRCSSMLPVDGHCPSIDLALTSLARCHGPAAAGVLLTGMGEDGALGLLDIHQAGGFTLAQDQATSIVYGMPRRAVELRAASAVLSLPRIAECLQQIVAARRET